MILNINLTETYIRECCRRWVERRHLVVEAVLAGELHGRVAAQRGGRGACAGGRAADRLEVGQLAAAQAALAHAHRQLPPAADGQRLRAMHMTIRPQGNASSVVFFLLQPR